MDDDRTLRDIATLAQLAEWGRDPGDLPDGVREALHADAAAIADRYPEHRVAGPDDTDA
ncbi:hypothetical protein [Streptomyces sp. NPDC049881]|uniref:hypothetical protein n=1 Tax=Streptomyces sp. NPDC049881 TaxID=3155778 RepID=UPI003441D8FD